MNKLDELITALCLNGVAYCTLNTVCDVYDGTHKTPAYTDSGIKFASVENISNPYATEKRISVSDYEQYKIKPQRNDLLMTRIGSIGVCTVLESDEPLAYYVSLALLRPNGNKLNSKYLKYALESSHCRKELRKRTLINAVPIKINMGDIGKITLPIPPIPVQHEIVRILDTFTELTSELTENLSMELTARKQQYEYYRNKLLDKQQSSTKIITIGELGSWSGGKTPTMDNSDYWEDGTIPWITSKDMKVSTLEDTEDHITEKAVNEASMTVYPSNGIAVVTRSGILKHTLPVAFVPFEATVNQDIKMLTVYEGVLPRYAFHAIQGKSPDILTKTKKQGGTVDSLEFKKFLDYKIPLPSLAVQQRLVEVLDNFDAICTDLNIGLPAEIEARKKQYEYYRDKLLSFTPAD